MLPAVSTYISLLNPLCPHFSVYLFYYNVLSIIMQEKESTVTIEKKGTHVLYLIRLTRNTNEKKEYDRRFTWINITEARLLFWKDWKR